MGMDWHSSGITTSVIGALKRGLIPASLAGNYLGRIDLETGIATVLEPPVPRQGARRVWSDSRGALWITGWNSGDLFRYDCKTKSWGTGCSPPSTFWNRPA